MSGDSKTLQDLSPAEKRRLLAEQLREHAAKPSEFGLSYGQKALWLLDQFAPDSAAYNIAFTARIVSPLNVAVLREAFQRLVDRHATLRSSFPSDLGEPRQRVQTGMTVPFDHLDASTWSAERVQEEIALEIARPFDLATGPVLRVSVYTRTDRESYLVAAFHHIAMDGWALWLCLTELGQLYTAALTGTPVTLAAPANPVEYVRWQQVAVEGAEGPQHLDYWKQSLGTDLPVLNLPTDKVRPATPRYQGATHKFRLGASVTDGLRRLTAERRATLQMAVFALYQIALSRYTNQNEFIVGYLAAGRSRPEFENLVAYLANFLPIRVTLPRSCSFRHLLTETRNTLLDALDHQDYPFARIVEEVSPQRDASRYPLFQATFAYEKPQLFAEDDLAPFIIGASGGTLQLGEITLESLPFSAQQEGQYDLSLVVTEYAGDVLASIYYNTDLFEASTIERFADHVKTLAAAAVADPDGAVAMLPMLTAAERTWLDDLNATAAPIPAVCFHELFEQHVRARPDALAVTFDDVSVSYDQLNRRANQLAHYLRRLGVGPDVPVGLCVSRSAEMMVAMLGILKAGGAFLPLDATYPRDRLAFMIDDSKVLVLVTEPAVSDRLPPFTGHVVDVHAPAIHELPDDAPASGVRPEHLMYMIYTSGSTGRPKGVLIEHRGLVNLALEEQRLLGVGPSSRVLQFSTLSFDAAILETAMALGSGGSLHVYRSEQLLPGQPLLDAIRARQLNTVMLPPSALLNTPFEALPVLHTIAVGGEACPPELVTEWAPGRAFFNLYGPTEGTIFVAVARCADGRHAPPLGRPIANIQLYVLDAELRQLPVGVPGELHIGGVGLARGYHERPELTAAKFVPNPFSTEAGSRLYKTGDLVRLRADGQFEFLGRTDHQVKVRGFRIELGEIEIVLGQHPDVNHAVAVAREDTPGERRLAVYVVPKPGAPRSTATLRAFLKARLPDHMVPAAIVFVDELPLNSSGKVDRRALPAPVQTRPDDTEFVAPTGDLEEQIASVWRDVLGVEHVGANDNFFDIGGTSLLIARVHARIGVIAPTALTVLDMFQFPTVRALATGLTQRRVKAPQAATDARLAGRLRLQELAKRQRQTAPEP